MRVCIVLVFLFLAAVCCVRADIPTQEDVASFEAWLDIRSTSFVSHERKKIDILLVEHPRNLEEGYIGNVKAVAREDIKKGEKIYRYPTEAAFNTPSPKEGEKERKKTDDFSVDPYALAHLLSERDRADSAWAPYLKILPSPLNTPVFWTKEELDELRGTTAYSSAVRVNRTITSEYKRALKIYEGDSGDVSGVSHTDVHTADAATPLRTPSPTLQEYAWAYSVYRARTWKTVGGNKVLPVLELFNYGSKANVNVSTIGHELIFTANEDIAKGEKIIINDGMVANGVLLEWYGFVVQSNPMDFYPVGIGLDEEDKLFGWKLDKFKQRRIEDGQTFMLKKNHIPPDLVFALRIYHATVYDHSEVSEAFEGKAVSVQNEMRVCETIIELCERTLENMPYSLTEDNKREGEIPTNLRSAITIRRTEKIILRSVLKMAKEQLQHVQDKWDKRSFDIPTIRDNTEL